MLFVGLVIWMIGLCAVDAQPVCVSCLPGKFKSTITNSQCESCPSNTYFGGHGGVSIDVCTNCTSNSVSPLGSSSENSCICQAGYTKTGLTCTACAAGKFKTSNGDGLCNECAANSATLITGSKNSGDCQCNAGYEGVPGSCQPSPVGWYKASPGIGGSLLCPTGSTSLAASTAVTDCFCKAGFTGPNGATCSESPAGTYKSSTGSGAALPCPSGSTSPAGSIDIKNCSCLPGLTGPNGLPCAQCGVGQYRDGTTTGCINCPVSTFSDKLGATSIANCTKCRPFSTSGEGSGSANDCKCDAGFWTQDMNLPTATCLLCVPGKFAAKGAAACSLCLGGTHATASGSTSDTACSPCGSGTYSWVNKSQCETCPSNAWSPVSSEFVQNCTCNAGYWAKNTGANGGSCSACEPGSWKAVRGPQACTLLTAGLYSDVIAATSAAAALPCPGNSMSPAGSGAVTQCACVAGYAGNITVPADKCVACVPGKYRTAAALPSDGCSNCDKDTFSTMTAKTDSFCQGCGQFSKSPAGSSSSASCMCSAGYGVP